MASYTLDLDRRAAVMRDMLDKPPKSSSEEYLASMARGLAKKCRDAGRDDLADTLSTKNRHD